jgi:hypothetical protein
MKKRPIAIYCLLLLAGFVIGISDAAAYQRYEGTPASPSCSACHAGFIGMGTLHSLHLGMTGTCSLCHTSTGDNALLSNCAGCHTGEGLRKHHASAGAPADSNGLTCAGCHPGDPLPAPENILPPYYSLANVSVKNPCEAQPGPPGEDFNGDLTGLDNDGDLAYDMQDADCSPLVKSLTVTAPNGGESWKRNSGQNISWSTGGSVGNLNITLWQNSALIGTVAENVNSSSGSYRWRTGTYTSSVAPLGTGYTIKIEEQGTGLSDESSGPFSIVKLSVKTPNGGETWQIGTTQNITWVNQSIGGNLRIVLLRNGAKVGNIADSLAPSTSSYAWTAGSYTGGTAAAGTGYQVQVREIGTTAGDRSDTLFTLTAP